jgi:hypothetical protein
LAKRKNVGTAHARFVYELSDADLLRLAASAAEVASRRGIPTPGMRPFLTNRFKRKFAEANAIAVEFLNRKIENLWGIGVSRSPCALRNLFAEGQRLVDVVFYALEPRCYKGKLDPWNVFAVDFSDEVRRLHAAAIEESGGRFYARHVLPILDEFVSALQTVLTDAALTWYMGHKKFPAAFKARLQKPDLLSADGSLHLYTDARRKLEPYVLAAENFAPQQKNGAEEWSDGAAHREWAKRFRTSERSLTTWRKSGELKMKRLGAGLWQVAQNDPRYVEWQQRAASLKD